METAAKPNSIADEIARASRWAERRAIDDANSCAEEQRRMQCDRLMYEQQRQEAARECAQVVATEAEVQRFQQEMTEQREWMEREGISATD